MEDKQFITIDLEEYKELLIIKGKYEELKSQHTFTPGIRWNGDNINFKDVNDIPVNPYKYTCLTEDNSDRCRPEEQNES